MAGVWGLFRHLWWDSIGFSTRTGKRRRKTLLPLSRIMTVGMYGLDIFAFVLDRFLLYLYWRVIDSHLFLLLTRAG